MQMKVLNIIKEYFLGVYEEDSLEIQKKTQSMLVFTLILIPILLGYLIIDLITNLAITWIFIGDLTFFIALVISLICIKNHKPQLATNLFIGSYINIFFAFSLGDYFFLNEYLVEEILITTLFLVIAILIFSLLVLNKNHFILHGIIGNSIIIFHYTYILQKNQKKLLEHFDFLIISLILLNVSIYVSLKIYILYHELLISKSERQVLTKVIEGFIPICANCKSIRLGENEEDEWQDIEQYLFEKQSLVKFTHTICKKCQKKIYPDLDL